MTTLVIGGSGMLGSAIVRLLIERGTTVHVFDRIAHPDPTIPTTIGDVRDAAALDAAIRGAETVIHTVAAVSQTTQPNPAMYAINVGSVETTIASARKHGAKRLIYTSSIDVVFDGTPINGGDETLPYPAAHLDYYGTTKMEAEKLVIAANGVGGLATCSLRTGAIFGVNDNNRFPVVLGPTLESGKFIRMGDGTALQGFVYVDNAAYGHVLAAEALTLDHPAAGQAYFINDHTVVNFFDFFIPYLEALKIPYQEQKIGYGLARLLTLLSRFSRPKLNADGIPASGGLSRYAIEATCQHFWFRHDKAARDLGYAPIVDQETAFARTVEWLRGWLAKFEPRA